MAYNLSRGLQDLGVSVVVVTSQALLERFRELRPSAVYALPDHEGNVLRRGRAILEEVSCLRQIIAMERPDIIHVHGGLPRLLMLATDTDQVVVETLHGVGLKKSEAFARLVHRVTDLLAALSFDGSVFYMRRIIGDYSRLRLLRPNAVIYNSVDEDFSRSVSQAPRPPIDGEYVLWCGRLDAIKGADILLRAFASIGDKGVSLVFLGDGPQRNYLEELAKSLHIDGQTTFRGYVDGLEKARFFRHASAICVNLANPELSQSLLEGVFSGNPTIAFYDSEVEQIFGESVSLIDEPSPDKLATILGEILKRRQGAKREIAGAVSLERRFLLRYFAEQYLAFYSRVKSGSSH
ncbi:MAG: glycosyltransferase family 4 protein [Thaumarchaeota archaeon]|nr:glycosyltransferase family 4 protein [Nitrososphaerota archaeon]